MGDDVDNQPRRRRALGSGTSWLAAGSAVNGLAAFGFQLVGTRALGSTAYAPIGVLWTLQYLWIAIAVTAVEAYVTRTATVAGPGSADLARFRRLFARWLLLTAVVSSLAGWTLREPLFDGLGGMGAVFGLLVLGYGWYGVVRGEMAGAARFRSYSIATATESGLRMLAAVVVVGVSATTQSLAWVFPLGPFVVIAWLGHRRQRAGDRSLPTAGVPGRPREDPDELSEPRRSGRRFLAATSTANASVQLLLAGGPLVLLPLGADAAAVSVFFTTITAARVPMTFALNGGLSRFLPPLTRLAQSDDSAGIRRASLRLLLAIAVTTVTGAAAAAAVGPELIALVFGEGFRPGRAFVVLVATGTVLAVGGLLLDQIYIATGRERRLPVVWIGAVALAAVLVLVLSGTPTMRVATAFTTATAGAVVALGVPTLRWHTR